MTHMKINMAQRAVRWLGWLLVGLLGVGSAVQAACNANIPLTRPDSRYEVVAGATPAGSEVRDKVTGLIWQRCVMGMEWNGVTCTGTAGTYTWQQSLDTARTVTASTAESGMAATWRMPNHPELYSLPERACNRPAINVAWFPNTPQEWMWSSSPAASVSDTAWSVNFNNGRDVNAYIDYAYSVRLVRAGQ